MSNPLKLGAGLGAILLLTAPLNAASPGAARGTKEGQAASSDRSGAFFGFPDWDSRSGNFDRSRRQELLEADRRPAEAAPERQPSTRTDDQPPNAPSGDLVARLDTGFRGSPGGGRFADPHRFAFSWRDSRGGRDWRSGFSSRFSRGGFGRGGPAFGGFSRGGSGRGSFCPFGGFGGRQGGFGRGGPAFGGLGRGGPAFGGFGGMSRGGPSWGGFGRGGSGFGSFGGWGRGGDRGFDWRSFADYYSRMDRRYVDRDPRSRRPNPAPDFGRSTDLQRMMESFMREFGDRRSGSGSTADMQRMMEYFMREFGDRRPDDRDFRRPGPAPAPPRGSDLDRRLDSLMKELESLRREIRR